MIGTVALSVLVASSLSSPMVALAADTTTAGANQTGVYAEVAGQSASPVSTSAPDQQTADNQTGKHFEEPAVDQKTTAPNNIKEAAPSNDKQGSDISYKANVTFLGMEFPVADNTATIKPDDANNKEKTLGDVSAAFKGTDFGKEKAGDLVVKGDMSIEGDTTKDAAHDVEKDSRHDVRADLDVSAIHTSIEKSGSMLSDTYGDANAAKDVYVNHLETGLRSTFVIGSDLNGEFYHSYLPGGRTGALHSVFCRWGPADLSDQLRQLLVRQGYGHDLHGFGPDAHGRTKEYL